MGALKVNGDINATGTITASDGKFVMDGGALATIRSFSSGWQIGWAFNINNIQMGKFGFYGGTEKMNYFYVGAEYNNVWMTVSPDGVVAATTFSGALSGNASSATKLQTARTIRTNLASTSTASFNGTANIAPGVTGILPIANGGTGANTKADAAYNLLSYTTKNGDFNTYTAMGHYWTQLASCTNTPFGDNPTGRFGFLEVIAPWEEGSTPLQRWTNYYDGDTWVRSAVNAWNPWVRYLTSNNYSNYCLPATGGTLTGLTSISYAHTGGGMLQLKSTSNNEASIGFESGGTQYWVVGKGCGGTGNGTFAWWYSPGGANMMTLNNSGNLHLAGSTISFGGSMTQNTSPTVVATYINNNSANGLGFAYTSNLSVGYASSAGSVAWGNVTGKPSLMPGTPGSIELFPGPSAGHGGFIDFHYNNSSSDYTARLINWNGKLQVDGATFNVGGKVELWTDGEGGNIRITSPNGSLWSIDALNNNSIRFIWAEASVPVTFNQYGHIDCNSIGCRGSYGPNLPSSGYAGQVFFKT